MICKEDITIWFKGLEGDERVELMCSLLDSCLPLELRFLGTYIEYAANKHYTNLQRYEKTVNESTFGPLNNLHDATIRRKFCIYLALLYSHNKRAATDLFKFLEHFEIQEKLQEKENSLSGNGMMCTTDDTYLNEIKLLFSMASFHPAFTFHQKQVLRSKLIDESHKIDHNANPKRKTSQHKEEVISSKSENVRQRDDYKMQAAAPQPVSTVQSTELPNEGLKKCPNVQKGLNELMFVTEFLNMSLSSSYPTTAQIPSTTEPRSTQLIDQFRYQPVPIPAIYSSLPAMPFQNVQGIPTPITIYPKSPRSQVHQSLQPHSQVPQNLQPHNQVPQNLQPHTQVPQSLQHRNQIPQNMQPVLVKPTQLHTNKPGGVAQGPNGMIHTIYPLYGSSVPTSAAVANCNPSEIHFASSAPIPVRPPTRMYHPMNQGALSPNAHQPLSIPYNMSPYQSPMSSPITSPFTSPSPSPKSSPLPSPRLSPFPSPAESPMLRRKFPSGSLPGRKNSDNYGSVFEWLKGLRLHKYSEIFKDYTFDQMKVLTDEDLCQLGLTQGARKKFILHINSLIEKGFKGFGKNFVMLEGMKAQFGANAYDAALTTSAVDSSLKYSQISGLHSAVPGIPASAISTVTTVTSNSQITGHVKASLLDDAARKGISEFSQRRDDHFIEKWSDEGSQSTSESVEDLTSDDEVFMTRRPTVIENKDCPLRLPSCYNCGSKEHLGEDCIAQTMEEETYCRYGYRLNYDSERLKESKR